MRPGGSTTNPAWGAKPHTSTSPVGNDGRFLPALNGGFDMARNPLSIITMPQRFIDSEINALEKRMKELQDESVRLEERLEKLKSVRALIGVVDDTTILAGADVPQGDKPN